MIPLVYTICLAKVHLAWSPVVSGEYCEGLSDVAIENSAGEVVTEGSRVGDGGLVCSRLLGPGQIYSPDDWLDTVRGVVEGGVEGRLDIDLTTETDFIEVKFDWAAGSTDSSFTFQPPIGNIVATTTLTNPNCTGPVYTETCTLLAEPDYFPTTAMFSIGDASMKFQVEMYTSRSGVAASVPYIGLSCRLNVSKIPSDCVAGAWEYSFQDSLRSVNPETAEENAKKLHEELRNEEGVSMSYVDTNGRKKISIASSDICKLDTEDVCNQNTPPCLWTTSNGCEMNVSPTYTPPQDSILHLGVNNTIDIHVEPWGDSFIKVLKMYYTLSNTPDSVPSIQNVGEGTLTCTPPCTLTIDSNTTMFITSFGYVSARQGNLYTKQATVSYTPLLPPTPSPPVPPSSTSTPTELTVGVSIASGVAVCSIIAVVVWVYRDPERGEQRLQEGTEMYAAEDE